MPVQDLRRAPPAQPLGRDADCARCSRACSPCSARSPHRLRRVRDARHRQLRQHDGAAGRDDRVLRDHARVDLLLPPRPRSPACWFRRRARQPRHADRRLAARRWSCRSTTRIRRAPLRRCRRWRKRWRRSTRRSISRSSIISDSTNVDAWISESLAVDQLRRDAARDHAGLVSAALAQHRPQGRQRRRIRQALGRRATTT